MSPQNCTDFPPKVKIPHVVSIHGAIEQWYYVTLTWLCLVDTQPPRPATYLSWIPATRRITLIFIGFTMALITRRIGTETLVHVLRTGEHITVRLAITDAGFARHPSVIFPKGFGHGAVSGIDPTAEIIPVRTPGVGRLRGSACTEIEICRVSIPWVLKYLLE